MAICHPFFGLQVPSSTLAITAPTAYWKFDEATGNTRVDQVTSPSSCDLSEQLAARLQGVSGLIGNGVRNFGDGVNSYTTSVQNVSPPAKMSPGAGSFTAAFWIKFNVVHGVSYPISFANNTPSTGWWVSFNGVSTWNFVLAQSSQSQKSLSISSVAPTPGTWYLVIVWFDGTNMHASFNNGADTGPLASAPANAGTRFSVTQHWASTLVKDTDLVMDEVGWWKGVVLTPAERTLLYNSGAGRTYDVAGGWV